MAELKKVLAVVGPTAAGKTALAVELCKAFNGEVVSCDSMQIYKDMAVATAAPTEDEMQGIKHHLIGFADPSENFNVVRYCKLARECIDNIISESKIPVICGGTGLYYDWLVDNIQYSDEETDSDYRHSLEKVAKEKGARHLMDELAEIDPETAHTLHINNVARIIRALEIYHNTGMTMSESKRLSKIKGSDIEPFTLGIDFKNRDILYNRINKRVDEMIANGILDEARNFYKKYNGKTSVQAIGYKELKPYLDGELTLDECTEKLKQSTRRYAKRQLTWFRKNDKLRFLTADDFESFDLLCEHAIGMIRGANFI
ncbi:MAG: tRNA (adenosine(37)-N6)-dimethylallyltransferase MiaA [Clostridia bacterium]|nr:tRNA (adenosine(37)-N6)-dimethylallyltransferase MiaA [Clostridia bacterium]